jgi:hypothetical protein
VTRLGNAKILDFGLAKLVATGTNVGASEMPAATEGELLTGPGATMGTIAYMMGFSIEPVVRKNSVLRFFMDCRSTVVPECDSPSGHLIQNRTKREQVCPRIQFFPSRLFGRRDETLLHLDRLASCN